MICFYSTVAACVLCVPNISVRGGREGSYSASPYILVLCCYNLQIHPSEYYMITYCFQRCHGANIYCVTRDLAPAPGVTVPGCPKVVVAGRCAL